MNNPNTSHEPSYDQASNQLRPADHAIINTLTQFPDFFTAIRHSDTSKLNAQATNTPDTNPQEQATAALAPRGLAAGILAVRAAFDTFANKIADFLN